MPDIGQLLIILSVLLFSLTIHEAAHAVTADWYGDPTARRLGRVSLNPLVHLEPVGSVLLPLMGYFAGGFVIGWAKPVPVNMGNLKNHRRDFLVIAAAGPASNIALAVAGSALLGTVAGGPLDVGTPAAVLEMFVRLNLLLAVFNMLPIPPLDGGNVLAGLLPEPLATRYDRLIRPFGFVIVIVLVYTDTLYLLIGPPMTFLTRWLL